MPSGLWRALVIGALTLALPACGAGTGDGGAAGVARSTSATAPPFAGDTADCPLPATPTAAAEPTSVAGGTGTVTPGGVVTATVGTVGPASVAGGQALPGSASPAARAATVPGLPGLPLPTPARQVSPHDVEVDASAAAGAVSVHRGARIHLLYGASEALLPVSITDLGVLHDDGRTCRGDGSAIRTLTAVATGTAVLLVQRGPRCLNARPACLPAVQETPLRVDVVP